METLHDTIDEPDLRIGAKVAKNHDMILAQVRESFGKVAWSHKTHECQASMYRRRYDIWKWVKIVASILAAGGGVSAIFAAENDWWRYITAAASSFVCLAELIFKERSYDEMANCHQATATRLWGVREAYQGLIVQILSGDFKVEEIRAQISSLNETLEQIYLTAPRTSDGAYEQATEKIHAGSCSCTDDEVDALLPPKLRSQHA